MSESLAVAQPLPAEPVPAEQGRIAALDPRRKLQLALGTIWLFDGILQYQPSMFTRVSHFWSWERRRQRPVLGPA